MFLSSQKQMTGQIPNDCMYEFQPFCLVLNSLKMTVFLIIKNKKVHPVLNSSTDDGGEKCKNKMRVSIFLYYIQSRLTLLSARSPADPSRWRDLRTLSSRWQLDKSVSLRFFSSDRKLFFSEWTRISVWRFWICIKNKNPDLLTTLRIK